MMPDHRIIGLLTRALAHELSAVQLYLAQVRLTALWEMQEASARFRADMSAELGHAEQLMDRLLLLGANPSAATLSVARMGRDLTEMLLTDRAFEVEAVRLYQEAVRYCEWRRDEPHRALFARILEDELEHIRELDAWLAALPKEVRRA